MYGVVCIIYLYACVCVCLTVCICCLLLNTWDLLGSVSACLFFPALHVLGTEKAKVELLFDIQLSIGLVWLVEYVGLRC